MRSSANKGRNFADNVGITFKTPEEFFLDEAPRPFTRTFDPFGYITEAESECYLRVQETAGVDKHLVKPFVKVNDRDIILFCGSPGAGKSTFYWKYLKPLGYERVNQDTLKSVCTTSCFESHNADKDSVTNV
jgi:bifunctional polynucleotide phosphatase/kinase